MAIRLKSNITFSPVVEEINRKFVSRKQTCTYALKAGPVQVETQGWMGGASRTTQRGGLGACKRNYVVIRANARVSPISNNEISAHMAFAAVSQAIGPLMKDLSQISNIQRKWIEAKDDKSKTLNGISAYGYTYKGWMFAVQYAGKKEDSSYDLSHFPTSWDS